MDRKRTLTYSVDHFELKTGLDALPLQQVPQSVASPESSLHGVPSLVHAAIRKAEGRSIASERMKLRGRLSWCAISKRVSAEWSVLYADAQNNIGFLDARFKQDLSVGTPHTLLI